MDLHEISDLNSQSPVVKEEVSVSPPPSRPPLIAREETAKVEEEDVEQEEGEIIDDENAQHDDAVSMDVEDDDVEDVVVDEAVNAQNNSGSDIDQTEQAIMDEWGPVVGGSFSSQ